jgi:hypothetical protein
MMIIIIFMKLIQNKEQQIKKMIRMRFDFKPICWEDENSEQRV